MKITETNNWKVIVTNSFFYTIDKNKSMKLVAENIKYQEAKKIARKLKKEMRGNYMHNKNAEITIESIDQLHYSESDCVFTKQERRNIESFLLTLPKHPDFYKQPQQ
jgi:hypothetical protein